MFIEPTSIIGFVDDIVRNDNFNDLQNTGSFSLLTSNPNEKSSNNEIGSIFFFIFNCFMSN